MYIDIYNNIVYTFGKTLTNSQYFYNRYIETARRNFVGSTVLASLRAAFIETRDGVHGVGGGGVGGEGHVLFFNQLINNLVLPVPLNIQKLLQYESL